MWDLLGEKCSVSLSEGYESEILSLPLSAPLTIMYQCRYGGKGLDRGWRRQDEIGRWSNWAVLQKDQFSAWNRIMNGTGRYQESHYISVPDSPGDAGSHQSCEVIDE